MNPDGRVEVGEWKDGRVRNAKGVFMKSIFVSSVRLLVGWRCDEFKWLLDRNFKFTAPYVELALECAKYCILTYL